MKIALDKILPNPQQPRMDFDAGEMENLAESIRLHGVIQPIAVEDAGDGQYILIDGERRVRASRLAGLEEIEATVRPGMNGSGSQERLVLALVANMQRQDNNPIEEGKAFAKLKKMGMTLEQIGKLVGRSGGHVFFKIHLLDFPEAIQALYANGSLAQDAQSVQALRSIENSDLQIRIARSIAGKHFSRSMVQSICTRAASAGKEGPHVRTKPEHRDDEWSGLTLLGRVVPNVVYGEKITEAVKRVCRQCELFDMANEKICRSCQMVNLLEALK